MKRICTELASTGPNLKTKESGRAITNKCRRPDAIISSMESSKLTASKGCGEVKSKERASATYEVTRDLIRLNVFYNSVAMNRMLANSAIQSVGKYQIQERL